MQKRPVPAVKQDEADAAAKSDQVKLKPIMGIRPGIYLSALYSLILLVVLFFLLILPGLQNPGAMLQVKTEPTGAAIRVDDTYMGTTDAFFVAKGLHTIEAVMPGFETESAVLEIPGRIFGSLFFPIRKKIEFNLKTNDPAGAFAKAAADFAAWTFGGEPTAAWQVPLVLSESAYRIGPYASPQTNEILKEAANFAVTRSALRDLSRAKILLDSEGLAPSPAALAGSLSDILAFLSENPASAAWLSALLLPDSASLIKTSKWYQNGNAPERIISVDDAPVQSRFNLNGITFIHIPSGRIITGKGGKTEQSIAVKNFMISEIPVSEAIFKTFLNENPQWADSFTDYFEEEISVLSSPPQEYGRSVKIITGVTWYAADAFCQWLNKQLPSSMSNMEVRLPSENEWEYAAGNGIAKMESPGWEWCATSFAPLQLFNSPSFVDSPEKVLRGRPSLAEAETRASLPPELSSPFVTFRAVIAEKAVNR